MFIGRMFVVCSGAGNMLHKQVGALMSLLTIKSSGEIILESLRKS